MTDEARRASTIAAACVNRQIASALLHEATLAMIRSRAAVAAALVTVSRARTMSVLRQDRRADRPSPT